MYFMNIISGIYIGTCMYILVHVYIFIIHGCTMFAGGSSSRTSGWNHTFAHTKHTVWVAKAWTVGTGFSMLGEEATTTFADNGRVWGGFDHRL